MFCKTINQTQPCKQITELRHWKSWLTFVVVLFSMAIRYNIIVLYRLETETKSTLIWRCQIRVEVWETSKPTTIRQSKVLVALRIVLNVRFSQRWLLGFLSSGIQHHVVQWKHAELAYCMLHASSCLAYSSTLKIESMCPFEISAFTRIQRVISQKIELFNVCYILGDVIMIFRRSSLFPSLRQW
jgi:hypothetical protein